MYKRQPLARIDLPDQIFKTKAAKYRAVVRNAVERHQTGQPILIGTTSVSYTHLTNILNLWHIQIRKNIWA